MKRICEEAGWIASSVSSEKQKKEQERIKQNPEKTEKKEQPVPVKQGGGLGIWS